MKYFRKLCSLILCVSMLAILTEFSVQAAENPNLLSAAHLEIPRAVLTRGGKTQKVMLYNDTVVFQNDNGNPIGEANSQVTALRVGDTLTIPKSEVRSYADEYSDSPHLSFEFAALERNGQEYNVQMNNDMLSVFGLPVLPMYEPRTVSVRSYNAPVASVSVSADYTATVTALKTGITYIIFTDEKGRTGSFRLNVVPNKEGFIAYPAVASGSNTTIALRADGTVWAWGQNNYGQLGIGSGGGQTLGAVQTTGISGVVRIAMEQHTAAAVDKYGRAYAWGDNLNGACGQNNTSVAYYTAPVRMIGPTGNYLDLSSPILQAELAGIAFDNYEMRVHGANIRLLNRRGEIYLTGKDMHGWITGTDDYIMKTAYNFTARSGMTKAIKQISGEKYCCDYPEGECYAVLGQDGRVYTWGNSLYYPADGGGSGAAVAPASIFESSNKREYLIAVTQGVQNKHAIAADGHYWAWGHSNQGPNGYYASESPPTQVSQFANAVLGVSNRHSLILNTNGRITVAGGAWGDNLSLGTGSTASTLNGTVVRGQSPSDGTAYMNQAISVSVGTCMIMGNVGVISNQSFAVRADGSVYAWGGATISGFCPLGVGDTANHLTPTRVIVNGGGYFSVF